MLSTGKHLFILCILAAAAFSAMNVRGVLELIDLHPLWRCLDSLRCSSSSNNSSKCVNGLCLLFQSKQITKNISVQTDIYALQPYRSEFSPSAASRISVESPDYNNFFKVVSKSRNLFVNTIPKVMSSSINRAFGLIECGNEFDQCALASASYAAKMTNVSNMTRVIFIRDPFERALSAYSNSVENQYIYLTSCKSRLQCTFDEWVQELVQNANYSFQNPHFRPQSDIAQLDKMHYHFYLRMSSNTDQHFFWKKLMRMERKSIGSIWTRKRNHYNQAQLLTPTIHEMLQEMNDINATLIKLAHLYKDDLIMWQHFLQYGTPRLQGETTMYDYYKKFVEN